MPLLVLRHARARRLRLRYDAAADTLRLTMPPRASLRSALAWAAEKRDWILSQRGRAPDLVQIADGALIPVEGKPVRIIWSADAPRAPLLDGNVLRVGGPQERAGERILRWLKARARDALSHETHELAGRHGYPLRSVGIGDARSRWGSCASNGVIRYSWRLILAPEHVRLATVAHEVAHLVHMNHSPAFHTLVAQISASDPDTARAWLRREGAGLHRYTV